MTILNALRIYYLCVVQHFTSHALSIKVTYCTFYLIDINGVNSIISSPNFPDTFPEEMDFFWNASIPKNMTISLEFMSFDLYGGTACG